MKVSDLIEKLKLLNPDNEVTVFAEGKIYPALEVGLSEVIPFMVEIGCGWSEIDEENGD